MANRVIELLLTQQQPEVNKLSAEDLAKISNFAQKAVVRALSYNQGDIESLNDDAQADFTSEGWDGFNKWLNGYLDTKGAPMGSSNFTPKDIKIISQDYG